MISNHHTLKMVECRSCIFWQEVKLKFPTKVRRGDCTNQEAITNIRFKTLMTTATHCCEHGKENEQE